jgi:serine/threonine protein kinase
MGEVHQARDTRLGREVAVKILPVEFAADPSRLRRFEKEARAASALNHPNIVTVYDIGQTDSIHWIAMEKVEGKTLRETLVPGALPIKRLLAIAAQIADGLSRAHEAGIVHRDLKPENVMVTKDGLVKILDFGLAKQTSSVSAAGSGEGSHMPTETGTSPGVVLGTVGYMSPEQAAGQPVDFRSDQFAFGSILYEMATGKRAFQKSTAVDTLSAILHDEPEPAALRNPGLPAPLGWVLERCLSKDPDGRYASTKDLARELVSIRDHLSDSGVAAPRRESRASRRRTLLILSLLVAAVAGGWLWNRSSGTRSSASPLRFEQVTFGERAILNARFGPDGEDIVYAANVGDSSSEVFLARVGSPESRSLGIRHADVKSISSTGQMALLLGDDFRLGTLAVASLAGGTPRELIRDARGADWSPDGKELAVVRRADGKDRLEYPPGHLLYEIAEAAGPSNQAILTARVSRKGDRVGFWAYGFLVVDRSGKVLRLGNGSGDGLAWSPRDDELWFTAYARGKSELRAISLAGKERLLASLPGDFVLMDVSASGRVLLERGIEELKVYGKLAGDEKERDLTYLDATMPMDISSDGREFLFLEKSPGWTDGELFLRTGASAPVRLGRGSGGALSPDGAWAVTSPHFGSPEVTLLPVGAGQPIRLPAGDLLDRTSGSWTPDGRRIVFSGRAPGHKSRLYVQDIAGGLPRPITPEGTFLFQLGLGSVSPDGRLVLGRDEEWRVFLYPIDDRAGMPRAVPGIERGERPIQWAADGSAVFVLKGNAVSLVNVSSGEHKLWREFPPPDPRLSVATVHVTPDGKSWVRSYGRWTSNLQILEGVR